MPDLIAIRKKLEEVKAARESAGVAIQQAVSRAAKSDANAASAKSAASSAQTGSATRNAAKPGTSIFATGTTKPSDSSRSTERAVIKNSRLPATPLKTDSETVQLPSLAQVYGAPFRDDIPAYMPSSMARGQVDPANVTRGHYAEWLSNISDEKAFEEYRQQVIKQLKPSTSYQATYNIDVDREKVKQLEYQLRFEQDREERKRLQREIDTTLTIGGMYSPEAYDYTSNYYRQQADRAEKTAQRRTEQAAKAMAAADEDRKSSDYSPVQDVAAGEQRLLDGLEEARQSGDPTVISAYERALEQYRADPGRYAGLELNENEKRAYLLSGLADEAETAKKMAWAGEQQAKANRYYLNLDKKYGFSTARSQDDFAKLSKAPAGGATYAKLVGNNILIHQPFEEDYHWDYMTDDEKATLYYLYNTQGEDAAKAYMLDYLGPGIDEIYAQDQATRIYDETQSASGWDKAAYSMASVFANAVAAPASFVGNAGQVLGNAVSDSYNPESWKPVNSYGDFSMAARNARTSRQAVADSLSPVGSFLYQTGMSMADNLVLMPTGQVGTLALMGLNAADAQYAQDIDSGVDPEKAIISGAIAGGIEILTETASIEHLFNAPDTETFLRGLAKQALFEGTEEGASDVLNLIREQALYGKTSYGNTPEEHKQWFRELLLDMAGGALSGGVMYSGFGGARYALQRGERKTAAEAFAKQTNTFSAPMDGTSEAARAKAQSRAEGMQISDEGASVGGEQVRVNGITQVAGENGEAKVTVTMPDGSAREVSMSEVMFARESAELYSYAADMASPEVANAFRTLYTKDQDMARVATGMNAAYDMGRAGYRNIETVRKSVLTSALTDQQLTKAYELGAGARTAEQNRIVTAAAFRAKEAIGKAWRGGQVTYDNVNVEALSAEQKRDAELAAVIAGIAGKNVELFESQADENGRYTSENGSYDPNTNTIRLDVNAGRNNRRDSMALTALIKTMSHELTHDMQKNAPKEYARVRDAVLDVLESQENVDLNDLVDAKLAINSRLSREAALDEVVADACEGMLRDSDFAQRMQQTHPEAAKTLGQRLRELLGRIVDAIKAAYQGGRLSREASMLMREAERYRQIADMWAEGAQKAAEVTGREQKQESITEAAESESEAAESESEAVESVAEAAETAGEGAEAAGEGAEAAPGQRLVGEFDEPERPTEAHIDNRTWESVAEKSVEPFQNDYRYARSYMGVAAKTLLQDANESTPGKRFMNAEGEWSGQKRMTTPVLAELMDKGGWSWDRLKSGLTKISDAFDAGDLENKLPNNVLIKRLELVLDEMLTDGYTTLDGTRINPDTGYLAYKAALPGAAKQTASEASADGVDFGEYVLFSMRNPVEQTGTLIAVHNITEEKLEKALKLGGLPMPSIAIAKTDIGHQNFGGISLVFGKSTVDPQTDRRNKVYSADAWTPTFPRMEYEVDKNANARIYNKLTGIEGRLDEFFANELGKIKYGTEDMLNSYDGEEGLIQKALSNYGLKAAYLEENGGHAEVVRRQQEPKTGYSEEQAQKYAAIVELIGEEALKKTPVSELYDKYSGQIEAIWPGATKMRQRFMRLLQNAANYADKRNQAPRTETVTDEAATRKALDDRIDAAEYESWVRELYSGIVKASGVYNGKDPYTSTGNRRSFSSTHYPVTVEGIAMAMHDAYGGKTKNVSNMYNVKTLRAVTSETFKSIEEMHMNEGRLRARTQEEADALTSELDKRLNTLTARILSDKNGGREMSLYDQMTSQDQISAILHETAAKKYSAATIRNGLAKYGYEISDATARELKALFDDISEMPVNIFEAKPERAVYFDEVEYAIVPDDMSSAVRSELDKVVADVREYPSGDEARRLELLNERDDVKFQKREYTFDELTAKPDMLVTYVDTTQNIDRETAVKLGRKNVMEYAERFDSNGTPAMYVDDLGKYVYVGRRALEHGLDRRAVRQNATIAKIGDILKNSVVVNEAIPKKAGVKNTWILLGAAYDSDNKLVYVRTIVNQSTSEVEDVASIYAALSKKSGTSRVIATNAYAKARGVPAGPTISIAELLSGVKDHFSDVLSEDVARHVGIERAQSEFTPRLKYQPRDEQISIREVLANVMEDASTSADEMAWLKGYRKDLKELDKKLDAISQNKQIIRELMFKKGRTTEETEKLNKARARLKILQEQVTRMDEGLLKLEGSDFIRGLVEREAQKIRDREAEKRRAGIAKVRETQRNAAVRKNIRQRAKRLDRMLREPTDRDHIPEGLKSAMIDLMDIFTRNDDSAFGATAKDRERLYRAQSEYMAMQSADPESDIASRYDEDTADRVRQLGNLMNDGKLTEFGAAELAEVSKVLEHFEHLIRDQNDEFRESKRRKTEEYAREIWQQTGTMKGRKENAFTAHALVKAIKHMGQANITPVYFYKHLGGAMGKLGNDLLKAEGRYGVNAGRAEARIEQIKEAHDYKSWAAKKGDILRLETESGDVLELTREQALGIWASAKRERTNTIQRAEHLRTGGVILEKAARKAGLKGQELNLTPTRISDNDIARIDGWLTDQQKKYADAMVNYISTDMAELGNETSMELVGYKKFGEGYYYPYKTSSDFRRTNLGNVEQALIKNMGFTKSVVRNAKTPVVITDFSETVADHVNSMLMYNAFAAPQDQLLRVYDFRLDDSTSVKNMLRSAYGDEVPGYIEQQMRDLYGGVSPDRDAGLVNALISGHKRQAVLGSASVVIQQPTAIIRAMSEVNPKYFAGKLPGGGFEEAKQYAGTAVIKDMGGFDTSMSRGATDWINGNPSDWRNHPVRTGQDKISDFFGMGAEKADQLAWSLLWKAVKKEQADLTGLDINSEELKQRAGERFDEVVRLTQVYDSVMSKSQLMRNKNVFWKGATAFMAEPTLTLNMMVDAVMEARKGNGKKAAGIVGSVLVSIIFTNLAKALVTASRDDDDEEATWLERYVKNATDGLVNDFIPFNYVPIARDVYSKLQGYDVERTDMSIINDILAAGETILSDDASPYKRAKSGVQVLSLMTGIPAHNLWREVEATINTVTATPPWKAREGWLENAVRTGIVEATPIGKWFDLNDSKARSTDKLYEALMDGDAESAGEWRSHLMLYNGAEDDAAVNNLLRSRIKEGYENGELDSGKAVDMLTEHAGMKRYDAEKRVAEWSYAVDTGISYSDLKDEYLSGNLTDEEAIAARVEYGGADEKDAADTIAKWRYEKENGIAYADMKDAYIAGDLTEAQAIADMAEYGGVREADARQTVSEWNYEKESGGEWGQMKADYIAGRMTADEVVSAQMKYGGALEKDVRAQLLKWDYERDTGIAYTDMKGAYLEGGISREAAVKARVKYGGLDADAAEQEVSKWDFEADYGYSYDDMRDYYELGNISYDEAVAARVKYGGAEEDEAYFAVAGWQYEQETGGEWNGKFTKIHDAVDSGSSADMRSSIQEVYDHSAYDDGKKAASAVTSNITSTYKPKYLAATPAQRAAMEPILLEAYRLAYELAGEVYYGDSYKLKQIRKWAED